jgi:transposase
MVKYREILRLHAKGYSNRAIASSVSSSRNTVANVLSEAEKQNLTWPLEETWSDTALQQLLFPSKGHHEVQKKPDYEWVHQELAKPHVTLSLLWHEYELRCRQNKEFPYSYRQFCRMYQKFARIQKATMRLKHKPGEKMEVDWAGKTGSMKDPISGEIGKAYIFVAVLPYSQVAYVEAFSTMETRHWIQAHIHAFEFFRGIPKTIIPDNLKTGVVKATSVDPVLHRTYQELAEHYNTVVIPARVRHPRDKPSAEANVAGISTWIIAALRHHLFFSIDEMNHEIRLKLETYNTKPFQKKEGSRQGIFDLEEASSLLPLPSTRYEMATWKKATVPYDYHVMIDHMYYSVPYEYVKHPVEVRLTQTTIECFYQSFRIASHRRLTGKAGQLSTVPEHMPEDHRQYLTWDREYYEEWARSLGKAVEKTVTSFFHAYPTEKQAIKACRALMKLKEQTSGSQLLAACERVLTYTPSPSIETIKTILHHHQKTAPAGKKTSDAKSHGFTRGAAYFGRKKS